MTNAYLDTPIESRLKEIDNRLEIVQQRLAMTPEERRKDMLSRPLGVMTHRINPEKSPQSRSVS